MIIVRKTIGKGIAPEILKKQFPYEIVFGGETKYFTEEGIKELQSELNKFFIPDVIMPTGKEGTVIPDLVGLCPSCGEEISRNGVFNNHNCKKV